MLKKQGNEQFRKDKRFAGKVIPPLQFAGIFYKKGVLIGGRIAFKIKDYIDRRFMRKFQSYE